MIPGSEALPGSTPAGYPQQSEATETVRFRTSSRPADGSSFRFAGQEVPGPALASKTGRLPWTRRL